jgi:ketosteroid isomerase-like protein
MAAEDNRRTVQLAFEGFREGNLNAVLDVVTDDVVWTDRTPAANPISGVYHGKEGVQEFFGKLLSLSEFSKFEVKQILAEGDTVVVLIDTTIKVKQTGKTADLPLVHVLTFRGEKVAAYDLYEDDSVSPWM